SPMPTPAPPAPTSPTASEPTPTAEPTQTPPPLPPEAGTGDAVGAEAFIRHFFDVSNYAYRTGDTEPLREISDPECRTCSLTLEDVDLTYQKGNVIDGGQVTLTSVLAVDPGPSGRVVARIVILQSDIFERDADGEVIHSDTSQPGEAYLQMAVQWDGEKWRTLEIAE
ncbi:DUF6318 family protein, partial [Pseudokineococcus sp. 1T1Z-3]|uniref:DUF6318 family protein n=1 Tax=Pseudokineococcus sp. 1T1Z-3 TaxID=3132745 RepID=UPI0030AFCB2D